MWRTRPATTLPEALRTGVETSVLLVPVRPACTRAVGALGYFLERQGIPTTGISLVREHTETTHPPRALWVTFELGRPLGVPDDPRLPAPRRHSRARPSRAH